jgi:iron complex transport system ATP-binding protein
MLTAKDLRKSYGNLRVLEGIHLQIKQGECLGIIGPNGSGKSTLVKLLVGEEQPDQGEVILEEKKLSRYSKKERAQKVAVLPQEGMPLVPFTVEEVVRMGRHPYVGRWPWISEADQTIVEQVMVATGIDRYRGRLVEELSGGERQRVAIAKAMAQEPTLLVLDEPTTFLDIQYQLAILDLLYQWQREKSLTMITVLHDLNLAAQYCDRLLMMKEGKVVKVGLPHEVLQSDLIEEVYGVRPLIVSHPKLNVPQIFLQSQRNQSLFLQQA